MFEVYRCPICREPLFKQRIAAVHIAKCMALAEVGEKEMRQCPYCRRQFNHTEMMFEAHKKGCPKKPVDRSWDFGDCHCCECH